MLAAIGALLEAVVVYFTVTERDPKGLLILLGPAIPLAGGIALIRVGFRSQRR